jgi:hypothetical protein
MNRVILIGIILALAAVGPNIFPAAQAGYSDLATLAKYALLPSIVVLAVVAVAIRTRQPSLHRAIVWGGIAGAVATVPLEIVRLTGFHFGYMPGNLARLMGVLLLNRFMLGPSIASDIAGWSYHFWNGASFGIIYAVLFGTRRRWLGLLYGIAIGIGFMLSPVVTSLGVGRFGLQFSYGFPVTVLLAHAAFGLAMGWLAKRWVHREPSAAFLAILSCIQGRKIAHASTSSRIA